MSPQLNETPVESLGDYLRNARASAGLDFEQVVEMTKISIKNIKAMEENHYDSLPAEVFSRGFYTLYANLLSLDPSIVLRKYDNEKSFSKNGKGSLNPSANHSRKYEVMAERPNSLPFSYIGLLVLLLLVFGSFLCWYFSWNPATYLSEQIRNHQDTTQEQTTLKSPEKEFFELQNMLSIPSMSNASEIKQQVKSPVVATDNYIVKAQFKETTKVTLAIDGKPVYDSVYKKGESAVWSAKEKINITLPGKTTTILSLNKTTIHLPKTDNTTLTISIPNDLQE
ncbi:MAG: cytoskeleton protein RodZ [Desulforhopalus sp.]|jgi:cytoskeleton protein RodZ